MTSPNHRHGLVNRGFGLTLLLLVVACELALRFAPGWSDRAFRVLYGNSLSIYLELEDRFLEHAEELRWLALGDSLAMTQFEPEVFEARTGIEAGSAFNASFLGMSFPSQLALLHSVGREPLAQLDAVLFFMNPRRLSSLETPNTDVFQIGIPPPEGRFAEAWRRRKVGPLLDASRLYGLSRHLLLNAHRDALSNRRTFDQVERLRPRGGVAWAPGRETAGPPPYPYPPLEAVSPERTEELLAVLSHLRELELEVFILPSPLHPSVRAFASDAAEREYVETLTNVAAATGATFLADVGAAFVPTRDTDFTDYGHMNDAGAEAFTQLLADQLRSRGHARADR